MYRALATQFIGNLGSFGLILALSILRQNYRVLAAIASTDSALTVTFRIAKQVA